MSNTELDKIVSQEKLRLNQIRNKVKNLTEEINQKKGNISAELFSSSSKLMETFSPSVFSEIQNMLLETISKGYETIINEKEKIIQQLQKDIENVATKYAQLETTLKEQISRVSTLSIERDKTVVDLLKKVAELESENKQLKNKERELIQQQEKIKQETKVDPVKFVESHITMLQNVFTELLRYFRNTIGILKEAIELVKDDIDGHPTRKKVFLINQEILKLIEILQKAQNKLKFPVVTLQKIELKSVISTLVSKFQQEFVSKNIYVVEEIPQENFLITADFTVLVDILGEIITNSIESFSRPTDNKIVIKVGQNEENNKIFVSIEDNGDGIPEHLLPKVFNLFFTTKFQLGHYGIGLFKVYWYLKMFNATINITSVFNQGTQVVIEF